MKELIINVKSVYQGGKFNGMIQYDDQKTSIATRYTNVDEFLAGLEEVYELKQEIDEGVKDVTENQDIPDEPVV